MINAFSQVSHRRPLPSDVCEKNNDSDEPEHGRCSRLPTKMVPIRVDIPGCGESSVAIIFSPRKMH